MDFNALVDEITARVAAKLEPQVAAASSDQAANVCGKKPKLLALASSRTGDRRKFTESAAILKLYDVECAQPGELSCEAADYEVLVFFDLSVGDMAGIATGVCTTQFAIAARKALLLGKRLFAAHEGIELYSYAGSAPSAYYSKLLTHLVALQDAGMTVCPLVSLEEAVLSGGKNKAACIVKPNAKDMPISEAETSLTKHVVTERDIAALCKNSPRSVRVAAKTIITDAAREYASSRGIAIIRDDNRQVNKK